MDGWKLYGCVDDREQLLVNSVYERRSDVMDYAIETVLGEVPAYPDTRERKQQSAALREKGYRIINLYVYEVPA